MYQDKDIRVNESQKKKPLVCQRLLFVKPYSEKGNSLSAKAPQKNSLRSPSKIGITKKLIPKQFF
ncbi:hypothetical protein D7322_02040 [Sphingobacterium puteale]|uniref:Uncharacterized protein n=1 Tax=Sphingobacterium puteale TaxID=2420510 RepID=A0A420W4I6_9SPHI|nr:hypothetical protein D7322_02040 [Sphingobacterium puteale]